MARMKLGDVVKDTVSGFTGIALGRAVFLYRSARILVAPESLDEDGRPFDGMWIDEPQVKIVQPAEPT